MFRLDHKTALVTGAGSGIGKAIALQFGAQGAYTYVLDVDESGGNSVAQEIIAAGGQATFIRCNVADQLEVNKVVEVIAKQRGSIDILINNAGIAHIGNAENTDEKDFDRLFQVNVKGMYNCLHAAIPFMKAKTSSPIRFDAIVFLRAGSTLLLWKDLSLRIIPAGKRKCSKNCPRHNPLAEWQSLLKLPTSRFI
jgi:NAD(P)-dependent dehydrogenase (short-subunit alcohol dehydrogenase family)